MNPLCPCTKFLSPDRNIANHIDEVILLLFQHYQANGSGYTNFFASGLKLSCLFVAFKNHNVVALLVRYQQIISGRIDREVSRYCSHSGLKSPGSKFSVLSVDRKDCNVVSVSAVRGVQEFSIRRNMNVGAAFAAGIICRV